MTFSKSCRSTLNGISAACGKVGALVGTIIFVPAAARFGDQWIMIACAALSVAGFGLTWWFVPSNVDPDRHDENLLSQMSLTERMKVERRLNNCQMKVVYSNPSLFDFHDAA